MMQTFRSNMKIIFFILIFFFVGWMAFTLTGLDDYIVQKNKVEVKGMKYAGIINKEPIDRSVYQQRVQRTVDIATNQRAGASLSGWEIEQVADQVWADMVNEVVLRDIFKKRGIKVATSELIEYVKGNPLPELMREPQLMTDGRFDYDKYLALLSNPQASGLVVELERDARGKIPSLKLFIEIAAMYKLTDGELERAFKAIDEKAKVRYISFSTDSLVPDNEISVSDEEIANYYEKHKKIFNRPDMVDFSYILIPVIPGREDTAAVRDTMEKIIKLLDKKEVWDSLAVRYSEDPLASSGGDLGWFSKGDYADKKMVDLALSLKPGQISSPTLTESGFQIVRVDSLRQKDGKPEVKAKRMMRKIIAGTKRSSEIQSRARALRKLMRENTASFRKVAGDSGFVVTRTGLLPIGSQIPGDIETNRELVDFLFGAKAGSLSYPVMTASRVNETGKAVMLALVEERKERGDIPLAEATEIIKRQLMIEKKKSKAREKIESLMADYAKFDSLTAFARTKGLAVETSPEFTRLMGLAGMGRNNAFIGTAFGLPLGVKSDLIEVDNNFYLLELISRTTADPDRFQKTKNQLAKQIRNQWMQTLFTLFSQELVDKTSIEDLRRLPTADSLDRKGRPVNPKDLQYLY